MNNNSTISIVIPAYKKTDLFVANLKHNLPFFKDCEVIVVNDDPDASIKADLKGLDILLVENLKNLGFAGAANRGIHASEGDHILLLNTDVKLRDGTFKAGLNHFKKIKNLFAVAFAQEEKDGSVVGKNAIYWEKGMFQHKKAPDAKAGITAWAEGGSSLFDRKKLLELGGFDEIFAPFYWEDIDLSYRAWKAGYEIIFDPDILVEHHHETTISAYWSGDHIRQIAFRNQLLFMWKNIEDPSLKSEHRSHLLKYICSAALRGDMAVLKGFLGALARAPRIKKAQRVPTANTDYEIIHQFS